ncbi:uncharacterized protein PAE49_010439 [Odontesthes bonariensis]|uniref:uncharacterized protein LOC142389006 n=1 Tax=Odontesthes bonariensis TaxID=219752 RepID=UPI003F58B4CB
MGHHGEWRPVADLDFVWDQNPAAAVCLKLACGSVVSAAMTDDSPLRPVWWIRSSCLRSASTLRECVTAVDPDESEYSLEVMCSDLLAQPTIALSYPPYGVSNATQQGSQVLLGSDFGINCSVTPQYSGGSFQLSFSASRAAENFTLPAVSHSALFLFSAAGHAHQGAYSCDYHLHVFSHNFSSTSRLLRLTVAAPLTDWIIRLVLQGMMLLILVLCYRSKVRRSRKLQQPNLRVDGSGSGDGLEEEASA